MSTERIEEEPFEPSFHMPAKSTRPATIFPDGAVADLVKSSRLAELAQLEAWLEGWPTAASLGLLDYIAERKAKIERGT